MSAGTDGLTTVTLTGGALIIAPHGTLDGQAVAVGLARDGLPPGIMVLVVDLHRVTRVTECAVDGVVALARTAHAAGIRTNVIGYDEHLLAPFRARRSSFSVWNTSGATARRPRQHRG
ncbi:hypothetical protein [Pseudonocardia sp. NPDC049635]|uniref:hypothetical protein n=1 Tax=Pseudonocardia sp. NPDC049635 TaxID=3155506 RepID=UPI00340DD862